MEACERVGVPVLDLDLGLPSQRSAHCSQFLSVDQPSAPSHTYHTQEAEEGKLSSRRATEKELMRKWKAFFLLPHPASFRSLQMEQTRVCYCHDNEETIATA
ncbi:hypothetical protein B296_00043343 [Ensete ventricosum]|uniref:Uncharacterized protein n=1 Tax=Ensete ventricosum TaxID=4639 RepID=A0A426YDA3_ENSVE|nr:hypothetical protein B296_00043343 [Ensete ventricosum]